MSEYARPQINIPKPEYSAYGVYSRASDALASLSRRSNHQGRRAVSRRSNHQRCGAVSWTRVGGVANLPIAPKYINEYSLRDECYDTLSRRSVYYYWFLSRRGLLTIDPNRIT